MTKYVKIAVVFSLVLVLILSCTVVGNKLTNPATYSHTLEVLDKNRTTVLGLSAASAVASAAVSAIPGEVCAPISEEISEFTSWFAVILGVIYFEKYLVTVFGAVGCYILIPFGCVAHLINLIVPNESLKRFGTKFLLFGVVVLLVIPSSIWVSDQINAIYSESIELTVKSANDASESLIAEVTGEEKNNSGGVKAFFSGVSESISNIIEKFKDLVNRFVEAIAVLLVTTCFIPVVVAWFLVWMIKTIFHIQISVPTQRFEPKERNRIHEEEKELTYIS